MIPISTRKLYKTIHTSSDTGTRLTLYYYLLKSVSDSRPVYGIEVHSSPQNTFSSDTHSEEVSQISHSLTYVLNLLKKCSHYLVTPTDLFSALDTLIDKDE